MDRREKAYDTTVEVLITTWFSTGTSLLLFFLHVAHCSFDMCALSAILRCLAGLSQLTNPSVN